MDPISAFGEVLKIVKDLASSKGKGESDSRLRELHEAVVNGMGLLASAELEKTTLIKRNAELEAKLVSKEEWRAEKIRYALITPWRGGIAYALREIESKGEPAHWICPQCYERGEKSHLTAYQDRTINPMPLIVKCGVCSFQMRAHYSADFSKTYA